mgnify:CR=1 FL=1
MAQCIFKFHQCIFAIMLLSPHGSGPSFGQTWIPFTQECFVPNFIEIGPVVLEKKNFKFSSMYFVIISPWKNMALHLNKLESHSPNDAFICVPSFCEIGSVVLVKKIFKSCLFSLCGHYLPLKKKVVYHSRLLCAKFGWNCNGSEEKIGHVLTLWW